MWVYDWTALAQDRDRWRTLLSAVMNIQVPWNAGNFLTSCKPVSCSGRTLHRGVSESSPFACMFVFCWNPSFTLLIIFLRILCKSVSLALCPAVAELQHFTFGWVATYEILIRGSSVNGEDLSLWMTPFSKLLYLKANNHFSLPNYSVH